MLEFERWSELKGELTNVSLEQDSNDTIRWGLETKGHFTAKSLYRFMISGGMPNRMAGHIWKCKVPLKIKKFSSKFLTTNFSVLLAWSKGVGKGILTAAWGNGRVS
jgi:hypothetical protein